MGFMDKAKAAANDFASKAEQAMNSGMGSAAGAAKNADRYFRDLGVLAYLQATGRPSDPTENQRVLAELQGLEQQGQIGSFMLQTAAPPPPGAVAAGTAAPPPPMPAGGVPQAASAPPPPGQAFASPPPPPAVQPAGPATAPPPPPPPDWAGRA